MSYEDERDSGQDDDLANDFRWKLFHAFGLKWADRASEIEKSFGGWPQCVFNFSMFVSRVKSYKKKIPQIECPQGDHYYPRFKVLLKTGVIKQVGVDLYEFSRLPGQIQEKATYNGPETYDVSSFSDKNVHYSVNVKNFSCTCPDWSKNHSQAEVGHPARLCKHLLAQVAEHPELITREMAEYGLTMSDFYRNCRGMPGLGAIYGSFVPSSRQPVSYVISAGNNGWINFYIDAECYGYNPEIKRWARGLRPEISRHLLSKIKSSGLSSITRDVETDTQEQGEKIIDIEGAKKTENDLPDTAAGALFVILFFILWLAFDMSFVESFLVSIVAGTGLNLFLRRKKNAA